jgi:threonine aldolase
VIVVAEVREWRKRMGGTLFGMWPNAASAMTCLDRRLPRMTSYVEMARDLAEALRGQAGIGIVPDPPQTHMMHLLLDVRAEDYVAHAKRLAEAQQVWTWPKAMPTLDPGVQRVELSVGDATLEWDVKELAEVLAALSQSPASGDRAR